MNGLVLAEHLAALLVVAMIVSWLMVLRATYEQTVLPWRRQASAYYAANVALVTDAATVRVGSVEWQVQITTTKVEVQGDGQTFTFTPRHDDD